MIIQGRNLLVVADGTVIAGCKTCDVDAEVDLLEVSSPSTGVWREYIAGRKNWSVSASTLVTSLHDTMVQVGQKVWLTLVVRDDSGTLTTDRLSGWAFVQQAKVTGAWGNLTKGSFVFQGSGELSRETLALRSGEPYVLREEEEKVLTVVGGIY
jgi:predicted secreted protein